MINLFGMQAFVLLSLSLSSVSSTNDPPCDYYQSVNITGAFINEKGSALFEGNEYLNGSYGYFNDNFLKRSTKVDEKKLKTNLRGCFCHLPGKPCLPVCCPAGLIKRNEYNSDCYPYKYDLYVNTSNFENNYTTIKVEDKYRMVQRDPCNLFEFHDHEKWQILENGTLDTDEFETERFYRGYYEMENFCIDPILRDDGSIETTIAFCAKRGQNLLMYVYDIRYHFLGLIVSIVFPIITLAIYILVPEFINLRGKLLMCYMVSMVVFYMFVYVNKTDNLSESSVACTLVGIIAYGSGLTAIFFLNAINFDYFTTFYMKDFRSANKSILFRCYTVYSFGITMILVFVAVILDSTEIIPVEHRPNFGSVFCFLNNAVGEFVFFYAIILLTVMMNMILFLMTGCKMRRIRKTRTMNKIERKNYNHQMERETFCHLALMFLMIDFSWLVEIFIWATDLRYQMNGFTGFLEYSQGIWIFIFCILKRSSFEKISKRWSQRRLVNANLDGGIIKYSRSELASSESPATDV